MFVTPLGNAGPTFSKPGSTAVLVVIVGCRLYEQRSEGTGHRRDAGQAGLSRRVDMERHRPATRTAGTGRGRESQSGLSCTSGGVRTATRRR